MEKNKLPQKIRQSLDDFSSGLKTIYGEELVSVVLYGSCASNEFQPGFSNVNLLIVLEDTTLKNLAKASGLLRKGLYRRFNCLFFTPDYIKSSTDVFPVEFLDIKENYVIIYGKDLLSGLEIDRKNLRFQCEQELKAKLINLKSFFLINRDKTALQNFLVKSFNSFLHIARNLIRLKGKSPAYRKEDILKELSGEFKIDIFNLNNILGLKEKKLKLNYRQTEALFFDFVSTLEATTKVVDEL